MSEYSSDAVVRFLDYLIAKGLVNKETASARKIACGKVFEVLDAGERADIRGLDLELVMHRFNNLYGSRYTPKSLGVYRSRVSKSLEEFGRYKENPATFRPGAIHARPKVNGTTNGKKTIREDPTGIEDTPSSSDISRGVPETLNPKTQTIDVPIALRPDVVVVIRGLPVDLKSSEAKKISNVIVAMGATSEE